MKDSSLLIGGTALLAFGAGCAFISMRSNEKVNAMETRLNDIVKAIDGIADNIDLTVSEDVVKAAVSVAASKASNSLVKKAVDEISADVRKDAKKCVKDAVEGMYAGVEDGIRKKLEEQINLASIERIEKKVSEKVAEKIIKTTPFVNFPSSSSGKEAIIKACVDNGMDSWEISRILQSVK